MPLIEKSKEFLDLYRDRIEKGGSEVYTKYFEDVKNSRKAFNQIIPDDIIWKASDLEMKTGNDYNDLLRETYSQFLVPLFTAVTKKQMESLSAANWRFEIEGNSKLGSQLKKSVDKEIRRIITTENFMQRIMMGYYHYCVDGVMITQTVSKDASRKLIYKEKDNKGKYKTQVYPNGNSVDIIVYDPLGVILDWDCNYSRIRDTSRFAIVTVGWYEADYIKENYPDIPPIEVGKVIDNYKRELIEQNGTKKDQYIPVREYYLPNGYYYTIVADQFIVDERPNSNGSGDRIPINVAPQFYNPDCVYGFTPWSIMREAISLMSMAINQTVDNNSFNNNAPFFTYTGSGLEGMSLNKWEKNAVVEINPVGQKGAAIQDIFTKPSINDISQSAQFLFEQGLNFLFFVTGSSPASFGIQEKQIRTNDVASIINQSIVRSDSDMALKLESGFMNPTMWDILQIFNVDYEKFKFSEQEIPKEFFDNIKNIRVVNGSYLPEDKINRMGKAQFLKQNAYMNPAAYNLTSVDSEVLDSAGIVPSEYMKDPATVMQERIIQMVIQTGLDPNGFTPEQQQMIQQLAQIATQKEQQEYADEA